MRNYFFALWYFLLGTIDAYFSITDFIQGRTFAGCAMGMVAIVMIACMVQKILKV
jgi:hypothetical protein